MKTNCRVPVSPFDEYGVRKFEPSMTRSLLRSGTWVSVGLNQLAPHEGYSLIKRICSSKRDSGSDPVSTSVGAGVDSLAFQPASILGQNESKLVSSLAFQPASILLVNSG